jgi:hypothetical protein
MMTLSELSALSQEAGASTTPGPSPGVSPRRALTPLRAAFGQDEANHGTMRYPVDNDGLVRVPLEAVAFLTGTGGFAAPKTMDSLPSAGAVKLHHDEAAGCSYRGRQYHGDHNGDVLVPAEAAAELLAHGFAPVLRQAKAVPRRSKLSSGARSIKG